MTSFSPFQSAAKERKTSTETFLKAQHKPGSLEGNGRIEFREIEKERGLDRLTDVQIYGWTDRLKLKPTIGIEIGRQIEIQRSAQTDRNLKRLS